MPKDEEPSQKEPESGQDEARRTFVKRSSRSTDLSIDLPEAGKAVFKSTPRSKPIVSIEDIIESEGDSVDDGGSDSNDDD